LPTVEDSDQPVSSLPLIIVIVVVLGLLYLARRSRAKITAREQQARSGIEVGTEVMTTSGLYGTVVTLNDDDSAQLSIAPGIEVRWAMAALRPIGALPKRYRGETPGEPEDPDAPTPGGETTT
jgi:preprotein translocase subunit YajC